jgi:hypothetical protein
MAGSNASVKSAMSSIKFSVVLATAEAEVHFGETRTTCLTLSILARGGQDHVDADRCSVDRDDLCRVLGRRAQGRCHR